MISQLPLWQEEVEQEVVVVHHYMQVIHYDGRRYITDTACPRCQEQAKDMSVWSAQFVENSITKCVHMETLKKAR